MLLLIIHHISMTIVLFPILTIFLSDTNIVSLSPNIPPLFSFIFQNIFLPVFHFRFSKPPCNAFARYRSYLHGIEWTVLSNRYNQNNRLSFTRRFAEKDRRKKDESDSLCLVFYGPQDSVRKRKVNDEIIPYTQKTLTIRTSFKTILAWHGGTSRCGIAMRYGDLSRGLFFE